MVTKNTIVSTSITLGGIDFTNLEIISRARGMMLEKVIGEAITQRRPTSKFSLKELVRLRREDTGDGKEKVVVRFAMPLGSLNKLGDQADMEKRVVEYISDFTK